MAFGNNRSNFVDNFVFEFVVFIVMCYWLSREAGLRFVLAFMKRRKTVSFDVCGTRF